MEWSRAWAGSPVGCRANGLEGGRHIVTHGWQHRLAAVTWREQQNNKQCDRQRQRQWQYQTVLENTLNKRSWRLIHYDISTKLYSLTTPPIKFWLHSLGKLGIFECRMVTFWCSPTSSVFSLHALPDTLWPSSCGTDKENEKLIPALSKLGSKYQRCCVRTAGDNIHSLSEWD